MRSVLSQLFILLLLYAVPWAVDVQAAGPNELLQSNNSTSINQVNPTDPTAVRELVSRLSDQDVRALLIERLDLVAQSQKPADGAPTLTSFFANTLIGISELLKNNLINIPITIEEVSTLGTSLMGALRPSTMTDLLLALFLSSLAGIAGLILYRRLTYRIQERIDLANQTARLWIKFFYLICRLVVAFLGVVVFGLTADLTLDLLLPSGAMPVAKPILHIFLSFSVFAYVMLEVPIAPKHAHRRLLNLSDWHAGFIHRQVTGIIALIGLTGLYFNFHHEFAKPGTPVTAGFWLNLSINLYLIFIVLRAKNGFSEMLLHSEDTPQERQVAAIYPYYAIGVVVFTWFLAEGLVANRMGDLLRGGVLYLFMALLIWAPAMDSAIRTIVAHIRPPIQGEGQLAERAYYSTGRSYIRIGRLVLVGLVLNGVINIWNIDLYNVASAGLGSQFVLRLVDTLWILLFGYLAWEIATLWVNRKLAAEQTASGFDLSQEEIGGEGGGAGGSRLSTVLPLLRWAIQTFITAATFLLALGQLGVDTTPLLAGAGVVGLAIGFGAQKLVADVVSGIFFLIDDAFRAGEYVDVEGTVGTVEKISLRSMQLRHHRGPVHTIPYGEIPKVTNFSRDWVIMKLRFTVPFDTDLHKVKKIFKKIGQDLLEVPEYAQDLLQPFKSQGVIEVDDVGIVIRGKFMAKPGKQFTLRKEIYQRVQRAFDENGLQFARKEVRVKVDSANPENLSDADKHSIAAAAAESSEKPSPPSA